MPDETAYDLYGAGERSAANITRFLETYVDRVEMEKQGAFRVMEKRDVNGRRWTHPKFSDLQSILRAGLEQERVLYFTMPAKEKTFFRPTLAFCEDQSVVYGFSMDYETELSLVKSKLLHLVHEFDCHLGLIGVEQGAPLSEANFRASAAEPWTIHFWDRSVTAPRLGP